MWINSSSFIKWHKCCFFSNFKLIFFFCIVFFIDCTRRFCRTCQHQEKYIFSHLSLTYKQSERPLRAPKYFFSCFLSFLHPPKGHLWSTLLCSASSINMFTEGRSVKLRATCASWRHRCTRARISTVISYFQPTFTGDKLTGFCVWSCWQPFVEIREADPVEFGRATRFSVSPRMLKTHWVNLRANFWGVNSL